MVTVKTVHRQRRRGGTQPAPLSIDDVVAAALAVTSREGLERLTVKAVADELGVTSPAVYHYVDGKDGLVHRVCEHVTSEVVLDVDHDGSWEDRVVSIILGLHHTFARYPGVGSRALTITGPAPAAEHIAAALRAVALEAGLTRQESDELVAALHLLFSGWLVGKVPVSQPPTELTPALLERTTRRLLAGFRPAK